MYFNLAELTNWQIAELLLVKLAWAYSEGGLDAGRSPSSDLLDLFFALTSEEKYHVNVDIPEHALYAEIDFRIASGLAERNWQFSFPGNEHWSGRELAKHLLLALNHYQKHLAPWKYPLYLINPVEKICELLCKNIVMILTPEALVETAAAIKSENFRYRHHNLCNYFALPTEFSPDQ